MSAEPVFKNDRDPNLFNKVYLSIPYPKIPINTKEVVKEKVFSGRRNEKELASNYRPD